MAQTGEEAAGEAARRPHEPEAQDVAGKSKRSSDDGFAERADDTSGAARPPAPAGLSYPGFVEEDGTCSSSFLMFLNELEHEGVITLQHGDVPPRLKGLCGWTVHDDKLDEWKRRRQIWFMQGKEGKQYKANSLYQFMRRLGFFPTEGTKRASHGLDFDGSRSFKWDGSRRHKYIQSKKEKQALSLQATGRSILRPAAGHVSVSGCDMFGGVAIGSWQTPMEAPGRWQTPMEPPGRPLPVNPGALAAPPPPSAIFQYPWANFPGLAHAHHAQQQYGVSGASVNMPQPPQQAHGGVTRGPEAASARPAAPAGHESLGRLATATPAAPSPGSGAANAALAPAEATLAQTLPPTPL